MHFQHSAHLYTLVACNNTYQVLANNKVIVYLSNTYPVQDKLGAFSPITIPEGPKTDPLPRRQQRRPHRRQPVRHLSLSLDAFRYLPLYHEVHRWRGHGRQS